MGVHRLHYYDTNFDSTTSSVVKLQIAALSCRGGLAQDLESQC